MSSFPLDTHRPNVATQANRSHKPPYQRNSMIIPDMRTQRPSNKRRYAGAGQPNVQAQDLGTRSSDQGQHSRTSVLPSQSSQPNVPILKTLQPWQAWPELTLKVTNLPSNITTWQLWKRFRREGEVVYIEIFENRHGYREGTAKIRFSPVPHHDFWSSEQVVVTTLDNQGAFQVKVTPEPKRRSGFQVQSPVRKAVWYPAIMSLSPSGIGFGVLYEENTMMERHHAPALERNETKFDVDLSKRRITAKFQLEFGNFTADHQISNPDSHSEGHRNVQNFMFQIPFGQLKRVHKVKLGDDQWVMVISLDSPPQFYRKRAEASSHSEDMLIWSEFDTYLRQTDIVYNRESLKNSPIALEKRTAAIDIGRWTTYRFLFDTARTDSGIFEQMREALQDFNVEVTDLEKFSFVPGSQPAIWSLLDSHQSHSTGVQLGVLEGLHYVDYTLPFEVRYQLEACISNNIFNEHNLAPEFVQAVANLAGKDAIGARRLLESLHEDDKRIHNPMDLFKDENAMASRMTSLKPEAKIPDYCALVRKATITPTTLYLSAPTVETTNRIIRAYSTYEDRFLRVQFTEEKFEGRINSCADKVRNDEIFTRVYRTLTNGIRIGDRHYEFLAFGNSQFRENGAYFFSPTEDMTCAKIRRWMGDFSHITVVAKCAARLGLCFSTTRAIGGRMQIIPIDDVERNGYCFTDGVGKISQVLATRIAQELGLPTDMVPSAFQFRMGGFKGILAVSPEVKGQQALIRKSQSKFTAVNNGLEIIRCSRNAVATLNRQTITILSSLGVPDKVFNDMLLEQLFVYNRAMTDKRLALEKLAHYIDDNNVTISIAKMILDGFMDAKEPFLICLLHLWRSWSIKMLKEKARIVVEKGTFLLGCTDETGTLRGHVESFTKFGEEVDPVQLPQIFVQIQDPTKRGHYMVVKGTCFVGRNPSLHPGDIRVVQAVDIPALHHLRDVVVFPQQGERDIPNMCSGGDLDGDDFFVIWDHELRPREINCAPMDYSAPKSVELDRPIEITDIMKFFVRYMKNDTLPKIAHAHLAHSDYLDRGVKDPKCIELAHLHSKAVDYVKTGEPAVMPKGLNPRQWPHFMEKKGKREYVSEKILGQLYDQVQRVDFIPDYESPFDNRILNVSPIDKSILQIARRLKTQYDTAVRRIMAQHEIRTEFEVWSTFVLSKPRVGSDFKTQENMGIIAAALKERFRGLCREQSGAETLKDISRLGPFVAAMYRVTYEEMRIALQECHSTIMVGGKQVPKRKMEPKYMPLISFPWLFHDVLGRLAKGLTDRLGLEDLDLVYLPKNSESNASQKASSNIMDDEDVFETAEGIILHRGEVLEMSWPDNVDLEGNNVEQPYHQLKNVGEIIFKPTDIEKNNKPKDFDPLYDVSPPTTPKVQAIRQVPSESIASPSKSMTALSSQPKTAGQDPLSESTGLYRPSLEVLNSKMNTLNTSRDNRSIEAASLLKLDSISNADYEFIKSNSECIRANASRLSRHTTVISPSSLADLADVDFSLKVDDRQCVTPMDTGDQQFASEASKSDRESFFEVQRSILVDFGDNILTTDDVLKENITQVEELHPFRAPCTGCEGILSSETRKSSLEDLKEMILADTLSYPEPRFEDENTSGGFPTETTDLQKLSRLIAQGNGEAIRGTELSSEVVIEMPGIGVEESYVEGDDEEVSFYEDAVSGFSNSSFEAAEAILSPMNVLEAKDEALEVLQEEMKEEEVFLDVLKENDLTKLAKLIA